jgi:hypothetical protein
MFICKKNASAREIIGRLNAAAVEALADLAVRFRFVDLGMKVFLRDQQTPEALGALQKDIGVVLPPRRVGIGRDLGARSPALRRRPRRRTCDPVRSLIR